MNLDILVPFLLEFLAKSAIILAAAALINRGWHRASAAQRHLVWCVAFATLLLLPLNRLHAPRWSVPLQRVTVELPRQPRADLSPLESVATLAATANPLTAAPRWRWPDWKHAIIVVWSVGAGLLLAARLLGSVRLVWLRKATQTIVEARTQRMAAEIFTELGIRRTVELRLSPASCVPLTWGSLWPVLTLPAEALAWSDVRLAAALRHEAGHIARGDHFTRTLA
ncbi:MAG: M56 family metallopeptidase, partial [Chthoniobacteraceae bacterium]